MRNAEALEFVAVFTLAVTVHLHLLPRVVDDLVEQRLRLTKYTRIFSH